MGVLANGTDPGRDGNGSNSKILKKNRAKRTCLSVVVCSADPCFDRVCRVREKGEDKADGLGIKTQSGDAPGNGGLFH